MPIRVNIRALAVYHLYEWSPERKSFIRMHNLCWWHNTYRKFKWFLFYAKHDSGLNIDILNDELEKISYWLLINKLSLNKLKSKFMLFYQPQKRVTIQKFKINNTLIERVDECNYLGLIINKHLKWNSHVNKIGNKISQTIGVISKLKNLIPQKHNWPVGPVLTIYNSLIISHINYCILAWGHDSNRILKLKKKQFELLLKVVFIHTPILSLKNSIFWK